MNVKNLYKLLRNLNSKTFEKGDTILMLGDKQPNVFYIRKGLVRSYRSKDNGEEVTFQLFAEKQIFANVHAILFHEPSKLTFEALEKTKVYVADFETLHDIGGENSEILFGNNRFFGRQILKQAFQRVDSFVFLSPEKRYLKYLEDHPNIVSRAPDKYIANVLGITPVSLSRIRNRIAKKK